MSNPKTKQHPYRGLLINAVLVIIAFSLLAWTVWKNQADLLKVWEHKPDASIFAIAFLVYMFGVSISFVRWYFLVRVIEPRFRLGPAFLLGYIGLVFNLVIPGAVGGDLVKAAYLAQMDIKRTQAVASLVIDRVLGLLGLFCLAGIAGAVAWAGGMVPEKVHLLIGIVWVAIACGFLFLTAVFTQSLTRVFPSLTQGEGKLASILSELKVMSVTYRGRLDVVAGALLMSVVVHTMMVLGFYFVSLSIFRTGLPSLGQHLLIVPLTLFTTAVPLPFGALGLTEIVSSRLWDLLNYPRGATAMLGFRVLMYAGGLVASGVYLANLRQVRSLTQAAEKLEETPLSVEPVPDPQDING